MRRQLSGALLLSGALYAAFNPSSWTFRRQVTIAQGPFDTLSLDASVYRSSEAQLNDLRLVRSGADVPYVLRKLAGGREETTYTPSITDRAAIPGRGVQAILDIGGHSPHNWIKIVTDKANFRQRVQIEGSDDRRHWALLRGDGTIFDVSTREQHAENLSVSYPDSTRRYLRVTVSGWNDPDALRSVSMSFVRESPAERETVADQPAHATLDSQTRSTLVELDLGFERPFDRLWLDVGPGLFSRAVTVSVSRDRKNWSVSGFGNVERTSNREDLFVSLPEAWSRYVRVAVSNEDNPPLSFRRVRAEAIRRELIFPADQPGAYWLYSGNSKAEPVHYDLQTVLPSQVHAAAASLGPVEKNPNYQAPRQPVTERSPWLLPTVLLVLVPALGAIAFRMLRQVNSSSIDRCD